MTHITCRLTAKNRDQLRDPTFCNTVWANFFKTFLVVVVVYKTPVRSEDRSTLHRLDRPKVINKRLLVDTLKMLFTVIIAGDVRV